MTSALPFDDFRALLARLPPLDDGAATHVRQSFARMDKPAGSLGRLEEIAAWLAASTGRAPQVLRPVVAIFAGNHGVARHGVSPRPVEATQRLVELAAAGGAAINQICIAHDLGLKVYDLALHLPTGDFTEGAGARRARLRRHDGVRHGGGGRRRRPAGDRRHRRRRLDRRRRDLCRALRRQRRRLGRARLRRRRGDDRPQGRRRRPRALALHGAHLKDPLEILRRFGGREFAAIAGAILAARMEKVPVVLDGFSATGGGGDPAARQSRPRSIIACCRTSRPSPATARRSSRLGLKPLLDLGLHHGEGAAAGLAAGLVKTAALMHSGMAAALPRAWPAFRALDVACLAL